MGQIMASNANDIVGINEEGLNELILHVSDKLDEVSMALNGLEDAVNSLSNGFDCTAKKAFMEKFEEMRENFPIVKENIESYISDLIKARDNTIGLKSVVVNVIDAGISHIEDVTNKNVV